MLDAPVYELWMLLGRFLVQVVLRFVGLQGECPARGKERSITGQRSPHSFINSLAQFPIGNFRSRIQNLRLSCLAVTIPHLKRTRPGHALHNMERTFFKVSRAWSILVSHAELTVSRAFMLLLFWQARYFRQVFAELARAFISRIHA